MSKEDILEDGLEDYHTLDISLEEDAEGESVEYPDLQIKIERDQYSIYELKRKFDKGKILMDPSFQRNFVWKPKQKSELIESVIMGIPLPLIYLAEDKRGDLVVVDGRQRLTTFFDFLSNKFRINHLKILKKLNGKNFKDLEDDFPEYAFAVEDYQLIIEVIKYPTPDRVRFDVFDRVNRGGTILNKQEMRNALYQGKSTELLAKITTSDAFQNATGNCVSNERMKDSYIVLRAIAFLLLFDGKLVDNNGNKVTYKSDMEDLLGKTMDYLNGLTDTELSNIKQEFSNIMDNIYSDFGDNAFRMSSTLNQKKPINMTLFETIVYLYHLLGDKWKPNCAVDAITNLKSDTSFVKLLKSSIDSKKGVENRFQRMIDLYGEIVHD